MTLLWVISVKRTLFLYNNHVIEDHTYHHLILLVVAVDYSLVVDLQNQSVLPDPTLVSTLAHEFADTPLVLGETVLRWCCHREEIGTGTGRELQH